MKGTIILAALLIVGAILWTHHQSQEQERINRCRDRAGILAGLCDN